MKIRTTKKQIKALKGKFNVGVIYKTTLIECGQPIVHRRGISLHVNGEEFSYVPFKGIKAVKGLTEDDFEC